MYVIFLGIDSVWVNIGLPDITGGYIGVLSLLSFKSFACEGNKIYFVWN